MEENRDQRTTGEKNKTIRMQASEAGQRISTLTSLLSKGSAG